MSRLTRATIGIIGAGHMGQALLKGLLSAGVSATRLLVAEAKLVTRVTVRGRYRVAAADAATLATRCDAIIVAVKPQDIRPVLQALGRAIGTRRALVISIAAGVPLATLQKCLGRAAVVRVMPNLAATVGASISALARGRRATAADAALAKAIFDSVGETVELPERLFDAVTALSGSGPAYFFVIFQALRDAGARAGLSKETALRLTLRTALGSVALVDGFGEALDALAAKVASKGGTTEAALKVFRRRKLAQILEAGVAAAAARSKQLRRG